MRRISPKMRRGAKPIASMKLTFWLSWAFVLACVSMAAQEAREFVHGQWWNGSSFKPRVFYSVNGILIAKRPPGKIEVVDLKGGYVVPALGDAHSHFPDSEKTLAWANSAFLASGVFYVLNPNDIGELSNPIRGRLGKPGTVDVIFAHAGFTCSNGHPKPLYETLVDRKIYNYAKPALEERGYYSIDSVADIARKWPDFLATNPDFVKLYLLHSEGYRQNNGKSEGLRPNLLDELVKRAKAAGLRSGAHVESADDFHNAVVGGVDFVMHLPGYHWRAGDTEHDYLIRDSDAKLARRRHVAVVTTIGLADHGTDTALMDRLRATQVENLRRLKRAGVTLIVGTDGAPGDTPTEIDHLKATGVFSNIELLKMWSEITPQAIFPRRRIGQLREGFEASFVVLAKDPIEDIKSTKQLLSRVKNGSILNPGQ
jgi:hypothetical protein